MTIPIYIDDNISYPPFTLEKCEDFATYTDSVNKRIEQHFGNRYALAYNEVMGEKEVEIINPETGETETVTIPYPVVNPNYEEEQLAKAKEAKYNEALTKANEYQQEGFVEYKNCVFEMSDSNRKNLSDTEEALKLMGETETTWLDKDDNYIVLTVEDIQYIRLNLILAAIQQLWIVKYPSYKEAIANAETVEEVEAIVIDYTEEEDERN